MHIRVGRQFIEKQVRMIHSKVALSPVEAHFYVLEQSLVGVEH